jgi:hypothetical protein
MDKGWQEEVHPGQNQRNNLSGVSAQRKSVSLEAFDDSQQADKEG